MSEFIKVAKVSDIADPGKQLLEVDDTLVMLCYVDGQFYCIDDICTHDGGPLSEGQMTGYEIHCPRHGARFDVRNGQAMSMPATEGTVAHEVKIEGDDVFVRLNDGSGDAGTPANAATPLTEDAVREDMPATEAAVAREAKIEGEIEGDDVHVRLNDGPGDAGESADAGKTAGAAAPLTEDGVREELKQVIDPELFVNIVDLGLIYGVNLEPSDDERNNVKIEMTLTSPMCPAGPQLVGNTKQVLLRREDVADVEVKMVMDPPWSPDRMTDEARDQLGIF